MQTLIYDAQGTAMPGASALDLRVFRIAVRPMSPDFTPMRTEALD